MKVLRLTPPKAPRQYPETQLQKAIVQHLRRIGTAGTISFSIPNGVRMTPRTANHQKSIGMLPGVADLCVIVRGRAHFLEVKSPKGRQSVEQKAFEAICLEAGIPYVAISDIDHATAILLAWEAIRELR